MTVANLAVCFGPTIMKPPEETVAAIMNIKFCNLVVEILITYCDKVWCSDIYVHYNNSNVLVPAFAAMYICKWIV